MELLRRVFVIEFPVDSKMKKKKITFEEQQTYRRGSKKTVSNTRLRIKLRHV